MRFCFLTLYCANVFHFSTFFPFVKGKSEFIHIKLIKLNIYAFKDNEKIEELTLGKNVSEIHISSFFQIKNYKKFYVNSENSKFIATDPNNNALDGILYVREGNTRKELVCVPPKWNGTGPRNFTVYGGITKIWANAFYGCSGLETLVIPASCTDIDYGGFSICPLCTSLTSINVDSGNQNYISKDGVLLSKDGK